jgi:hypothetical protein
MLPTFAEAWEAAAIGMARAVKRAGEIWKRQAIGLSLAYLAHTRFTNPNWRFLIEDVRSWCEQRGLPDPPDKRAWGAIATALKKGKHIQKVGYAPAMSSNTSPKVLWELA